MQDLEVFKQIPGYKAILKAVLKNQIQSLVLQLAQQTGEESVLITASLEEGTLSQLGSEFGKTFLEGHDEIKSQFLGFCLKRNQIQKQTKEFQESKPRKSWSARRPQVTLPTVARRSQPYPVSMTTAMSRSAKQKVAGTDRCRRKQNKTVKTEATVPYPTSASEDYIITNNLPTNLQVTSFPSQGQGHVSENQSPSQVLPVPPLKNEPVYVNNLMVKKDSAGSLYNEDSFDSLNNNENQSTQSSITDGVCGETDTSDVATEELADITEEIVAGQVDGTEDLKQNGLEQISADEEALAEYLEGTSEGQTEQGQGQSENEQTFAEEEMESDIGMVHVQSVTSLRKDSVSRKGSASRKPKLKLFNQNKVSDMQKSLKERKAELENYLNLENTDRPYPCNLCPKRFKERHHLVYHLRTHSGHRPYVCSICNKGFTQSSSLNTHKKLHLKDMSCEFCGQVFRKISLLQNHMCKALGGDNIQI
ncbi:neurotrophin receptor-interacting factor homolog [Mercenaria mercenaria]|uniref:neurotrophin receptor-interacting factor homolog n=1 Tax=Mercenaria mercenaria TaxID=6596 RepID=UPI00234F75E1|nr:neurotrophin receptor-interacting factor homolog [Mercenaria mercenaria]